MANIKLKDLITEMGISGIVSESPWAKREDDTPSINVNELVSSIKNYGSLGEHIYGKGSLKEIAESLSSIAEGAAQHTLSETEDMFDLPKIASPMSLYCDNSVVSPLTSAFSSTSPYFSLTILDRLIASLSQGL